jgi:hypothetical protein
VDDAKDSETFTLETPDPAAYRSGPGPLTSGNLSEQLRESDRVTDRRNAQTLALVVILVLAGSVLVLITQLM